MVIKKPNFFIVGAPKCGTTSLSEYLRTHPNILMSKPKEPHYFSEDFPGIRCVKNLNQYLELFQRSREEHLVIGEASASYLYSSVAISNIYKFNKHAKIVVMLRNPIDMVYSLHSEFLFNGFEDQKEFATAWELQSIREKGINIPENCLEAIFLQYYKQAQYSLQIQRLFQIFPKENIKIILFDDFIKSIKSVYDEVLHFLDLPSDGRDNFPKLNTNKTSKNAWINLTLQRIRKYKSFWYPPARKIKQIIGIEDISFFKALNQMNLQKTYRPPLDENLKSELSNIFREDIEKLSQILEKDLTYWLVNK